MAPAEELRAYIKRTGMTDPGGRYDLCVSEINALHDLAKRDLFDALCLAYDLGQARGYRLAKRRRKGAAA